MKLSDKVYVKKEKNNVVYSLSVQYNNGGEEYIRKDTLIEWAKFVLKCQEEELAKYDGPSYMRASIMGRIDAYKVLIAKLNSM